MDFCPTCGKEIPEKAAFCPECGSELLSDKEKHAKLDKTNTVPGERNMPIKEESNIVEQSRNKFSSLPYADKAKRIAAALVDTLIAFIVLLPFYRLTVYPIPAFGRKWRFILYFLPALYLILRDSFRGKSFGKLLFGLSTVNVKSGKFADFADSILRNWFFFVIILPLRIWVINFGLIIFLAICLIIFVQILFGQGSRLGDKFANTKVIEDQMIRED